MIQTAQHQAHYYQAINQSTKQSDCAPFVEFMLQMIWNAIQDGTTGGINDGKSDGINMDVRLTVLDKQIIELLKFDAYITSASIADKVEKSIRTVERRIKYLKDNSIVVREGANKTGRWLVNGF